VLEWYDFALYGFFAPFIAKQFFPSDDQVSSLLATFGVFAVGFFMRPVGAVIFGILGDKLGRKRALEISVVMMAIPTTLIGVLPTHEQVGILAPILLTVIRLIQGVSVGGEFTGSISYVVEQAPYPPGRRGFYSSWTVFSLLGGILLGSAISGLVTNILTPDQMLSFGWRLPFFLGIVIGVIGLYLRRGLDESPTFKRLKEAGQLSKRPIREALQNHWREIVIVIAATCVGSVNFLYDLRLSDHIPFNGDTCPPVLGSGHQYHQHGGTNGSGSVDGPAVGPYREKTGHDYRMPDNSDFRIPPFHSSH